MKGEALFKSPQKTWYFIFGYLLLNGVARLLILPSTLWIDEAEQVYISQWFSTGAFEVQPPLFSWIHYAAFQLTGTNIFFIEAFKILIITLTYRGIYKIISLTSGNHAPTVVLCILSLPFILQLWDETFTRTNTIVVTFASVWAFYMVLKITENPNWKNYLLLGLFLAAGFLSKYTIVLGMASLFICGLAIPKTRAVILSPLFLVTIFTFLLVIAPHAWWLVENILKSKADLETELGGSQKESFAAASLRGLSSFFSNIFGFIGIWLMLMLLLFWREIKKSRNNRPEIWTAFLGRYLLIVGVLMAATIFLLNVTIFHERYFQPFFIFIPVYFFLMIKDDISLSTLNSKWMQVLSMVFLVLIFYFNNLALAIDPLFGKTDVMNIPYKQVAGLIKQELQPGDLIVVNRIRFAGNLKLNLPNEKILLWNDSLNYQKEIQNPVIKSVLYTWTAEDEPPVPEMIFRNKNFSGTTDSSKIFFKNAFYKLPTGKKFAIGFLRLPK